MTDRELMQMANRIEALAFEMKAPNAHTPQFVMLANEIRARTRLAQPEPKPVACDGHFPEGFSASSRIPAQALRAANAIMCDVMGERYWDVSCTAKHLLDFAYSYTAPPQREWQGLTDEEVRRIVQGNTDPWCDTPETDGYGVAEMVEAKLKEKNT